MNIGEWLDAFKNSWTDKDIPAIVELFSDDIEYWETPYKKLSSLEDVKSEWGSIHNQDNIKVETTIFSKSEQQNCFTVLWKLGYASNGTQKVWAGVYLIKLNPQGKCYYFYQTGEQGR
jgi:hypothetical protein